jgi:hypothetical protein
MRLVGEHGQWLVHMGVGNRVVVEVEADIGPLTSGNGDAIEQEIGVVRQRQQSGRLFGEGFLHAQALLSGTAPSCGDVATPGLGLGIEIGGIDKRATGVEGFAYCSKR